MSPESAASGAGAQSGWQEPVWRFAPFDSLTVRELQYIYMARQAVFSVEQQCAFMDADGLDERAHHLAAWSPVQREPLAYARLLEPGAKYAEPSIGRVITTAAARRRGLGRWLLRETLTWGESFGAEEVFLEVRQSNWAALALYRAAAFEAVSVRRGYYDRPREDALVLRRRRAPENP